ncbi:multiprotein-bridging factor 1 family protein [Catellatospora sp. TT07R-123]|uniref:helix-turn-helix domain-containing protein n=1 Tax=Catellatospora sp. TT07R-123 TaxID=2733863 RepID=UPI0035B56208
MSGLGDRLRSARKLRGLTQRELAAQAGVSVSERWEPVRQAPAGAPGPSGDPPPQAGGSHRAGDGVHR